MGGSISAGMAGSEQADDFMELLAPADAALYTSKEQGRNRINCA